MAHWPSEGAPLPSPALFHDVVSIAHQASLTEEEGRPTRFRLLLEPPDGLPEGGIPNEGVLRLKFERDRPFQADELRRLSPSTPFETALIGAHAVAGKLRIWGIAHSGAAWLNPTWGGRNPVPNWSYHPILHVTGPGQVAVRCAGKLVAALERGTLVDAMIDVFESDWLPALFAHERELIRREHAVLQTQLSTPTAVEHSLVGVIGQHMLKRAIQLIRAARHGGMLLILDAASEEETAPPATAPAPRSFAGLHLKYQFAPDEPPRRYRTLLFQILERVAGGSDKSSVGWCDFVRSDSPELERLEQSVFEISRIIASLAAIDGAVLLDKRLQLIGFGTEVSAYLPPPDRVFRALDKEGQRLELDAIENVGTRHRAAYRFAQHHPRGLAIVISHDGAVSFVASRNGEVVFWQQSVGP